MADSNTKKKVNDVSGTADISALKSRVDDQQKKIESIWRLVSDKKQVEQIVGDNDSLKQQVVEKDSLLKVMKEKLTEKTSALKEAEEKIREMQEAVDAYKTDVFEFNNKIGAVEKRVHATDEQNQKLLYELMKHKERLKEAEAEIAEKDRIIKTQREQYALDMEALKKESDEKKVLVMHNHSKKFAALKAAVDMLKSRLNEQNRVLAQKSSRELSLMNEFNSKMVEIITAKKDLSVETGDVGESVGMLSDLEPAEEVKEEHSDKEERVSAEIDKEALKPSYEGPSRHEEIIPMIELALDHGDSRDKIKNSLVSSGYTEQEIDDAFSNVHMLEK